VYKLSATLEEKVDYYAHGRKVARHDPVHRFELLSVHDPDKTKRLLPIFSDSPSAGATSPLASYARPEDDVIPPSASTATLEHTSDIVSHLLAPSGPWRLGFNLRLPDCSSTLHFTHKPPGARVVVSHVLKIALRVARAEDGGTDTKGKPKMFDIIVETPVHILSCQCKTEFTHLPTYSQVPTADGVPELDTGCQHPGPSAGGHNPRLPHTPVLAPGLGPVGFNSIESPSRSRDGGAPEPAHMMALPMHNRRSSHNTPSSPGADGTRASGAQATAVLRTEQFARLIAGQESEAGETPPAYSSTG